MFGSRTTTRNRVRRVLFDGEMKYLAVYWLVPVAAFIYRAIK